MFDIEKFVTDVLKEIGTLATDTFSVYVKDAKKDGETFLENSKEKLEKWGKMLAEGALSVDDVTDLVKGQKDLLEMKALTQAGIAAIKLEQFRDGVFDIILGKIIQ